MDKVKSFIALPNTGLLPQKTMCLHPREPDEGFYNSRLKVESLTRLGCEQGLDSLNLISDGQSPNLDEFLWSV